jgi:hypothetical protein
VTGVISKLYREDTNTYINADGAPRGNKIKTNPDVRVRMNRVIYLPKISYKNPPTMVITMLGMFVS